MTPSLSIFCGKGGVGKTTLSLAFGLLAARRGERVLVVTSHPLKELALSISLEGLPEAEPEASENLFTIYIDSKKEIDKQVPSEYLQAAREAREWILSRLRTKYPKAFRRNDHE